MCTLYSIIRGRKITSLVCIQNLNVFDDENNSQCHLKGILMELQNFLPQSVSYFDRLYRSLCFLVLTVNISNYLKEHSVIKV